MDQQIFDNMLYTAVVHLNHFGWYGLYMDLMKVINDKNLDNMEKIDKIIAISGANGIYILSPYNLEEKGFVYDMKSAIEYYRYGR